MLTARDVSVVVPVGHSYDIALGIPHCPALEGAQIILVADSDVAYSHLAKRLPFTEQHEVLLVRNPGKGVAAARNSGLVQAQRDYVWFLDSDCLPVFVGWEKVTKLFEADEVVGLGGTTQHTPKLPYADAFFQRFELTCHYAVKEDAPAFWAPSCNLLVRREAGSKLGGEPFPTHYPRAGGGEDVHFCLALTSIGSLFRTTALRVKHPPWLPSAGYVRKFARWGWAEGVLTCRAPRHNGLVPHRLSPAFLVMVALVCVSFASTAGAVPLKATSVMASVAFLFSLSCEILIGWRMMASLRLAVLSFVYMWLFEFTGLLARLRYYRPDLIFVELRYFPEQPQIAVWEDVLRILFLVTGLALGAVLAVHVLVNGA